MHLLEEVLLRLVEVLLFLDQGVELLAVRGVLVSHAAAVQNSLL